MRQLIEAIQREWVAAKTEAQSRCIKDGDFEMARELERCEMFHGTENLKELAELMFSARGIEFMTLFNFPSLDTFRKFIEYSPEQYGIFIDKGDITLSDAPRVFLIGNTHATINYREMQGNRLYLMCGATADITASGFAVVKVEKDQASSYNSTIDGDFVKIL